MRLSMGKVLLLLSKSSKQITRLSVSDPITSLLGISGIYSFIFGTLKTNFKIPFPHFNPLFKEGYSSSTILLSISSMLVTPDRETLIGLYLTLSFSLVLTFSISLLRMLLKK